MFKINAQVTSSNDELGSLKESLNKLKKMDVLVGIPQDNDTNRGDKVTNAELMFIHTNGSPLNNIPLRPVIEPAIENDKETLSSLLGNALEAGLSGDLDLVKENLKLAGLEGQAAAQEWFDNPKNGWPENSPRVKARKIKKGSTDPKPLIDTGELRKTITYVIRDGE